MKKEESIQDLMSLPNIGRTMANHLYRVGIKSSIQFKKRNPENLWKQLKSADSTNKICKTHLNAIKAAQQGVPMNNIKD